MDSLTRKTSSRDAIASIDFRRQSALCLAIARKQAAPAEQLCFLQLAEHWQRAADASDVCLQDWAEHAEPTELTIDLV